MSEKNNPNLCRNCKIWSGNISITGTILTYPSQQYNNSVVVVVIAIGTYFRYGRYVHSTRNETIAWQHMRIEHGGHDIVLDFQVLTSIYCQKWIKVDVKSKRITVQCVWLWYQHLLWRLTSKQSLCIELSYMIFWLIFWSYFVAFLGDSISINRPKCKPISIQWARCRSQLYIQDMVL